MKKFGIITIIILVLSLLFLATSCDSSNAKSTSNDNTIIFNMADGDEEACSSDGLEYKFKTVFYDRDNSCTSLRIDTTVTNRNIDAIYLSISDAYAIREENNAKYTCYDTYYNTGSPIECDKSTSFYINVSGLPTDIFANKYHLEFEINNQKFRINLYNDIPYDLEYEISDDPINISLNDVDISISKEIKYSVLCINISIYNKSDNGAYYTLTNLSMRSNGQEHDVSSNITESIIPKTETALLKIYANNLESGTYNIEFLLFCKHFILTVTY